MSHQRVPVLASVVSHICVLYEVINTVNLEVHLNLHLSCLVHLDYEFVFNFLSPLSLVLLNIEHLESMLTGWMLNEEVDWNNT